MDRLPLTDGAVLDDDPCRDIQASKERVQSGGCESCGACARRLERPEVSAQFRNLRLHAHTSHVCF